MAHVARSRTRTSNFVLEDEDELGSALQDHELRELLAARAARVEPEPETHSGARAGEQGGGGRRRHERRAHAAAEQRLVCVNQRRELLERVVDVAHAHSKSAHKHSQVRGSPPPKQSDERAYQTLFYDITYAY